MGPSTHVSSKQEYERYALERSQATRSQGDTKAEKKEPKERHRSIPQLYFELSRLIGRDWWIIILALGVSGIVTLLKLLPPVATKLLIDNILLKRPLPAWFPAWLPVPQDPRTQLVILVLLVFGVSVLSTVIGLWGRWQTTVVTKRLQVDVRRRAFEQAARLPLNRVYELKAGGAASLIRDDAGGVADLIFSMIFNPWRAIVQLVSGLVILAFVDWRLLVCTVLLLPAVLASSRLWNRFLRPLFRDVRKQRQRLDAKTTEAFSGMRVVRAFGRQRRESARFVRGNHVLVRLEMLAWWWSRTVEIVWDLILPSASGLLLLYGGMRVIDGQLSPGDLMMFLVYLTMLLEPVTALSNSFTQVQAGLAGFDRVLDLLAEPREMESVTAGAKIRRKEVRGQISFKGVSFHYPGSSRTVLHEINLDIAPGETVALVGRSGSGKTTLCNLVARFYDPTAGSVRLDGQDLREIDVESFRRILGVVEQDVFLFDGTVAENIAYARRDATLTEIENAARISNAAEFIEAFPERYETIIGERGVKMSGGQRQRIAIARAVLADARILILDEATSNLDSESERLIQASLDTVLKNRTSFVIAHRLSTVRHADRILVMEAGQIIEMGNHESLLALGGRYSNMVALQSVDA